MPLDTSLLLLQVLSGFMKVGGFAAGLSAGGYSLGMLVLAPLTSYLIKYHLN